MEELQYLADKHRPPHPGHSQVIYRHHPGNSVMQLIIPLAEFYQ